MRDTLLKIAEEARTNPQFVMTPCIIRRSRGDVRAAQVIRFCDTTTRDGCTTKAGDGQDHKG